MILLLDTELLLWAASGDARLRDETFDLIEDETNELVFSTASIWEVAIKSALGRADFTVDPRIFRRGLLENGYVELEIGGAHGIEAASLPQIHRDPFDRMLIGQARVEGFTLLTADDRLAGYGSPVHVAG